MPRERPNLRAVTAFPQGAILGAPSLVIPHGTIVRTPTSPGTLNFDGYNTLSLKMALAGLGGGNTLNIYVAAVDPESPTGDPVAAGLSQVLAIAATSNGNKAATVNLVKLLSSGMAPQFSRPSADLDNSAAVNGVTVLGSAAK